MKKVTLSILSAVMGVAAGIGVTNNFMEKTMKKNSAMSNKHLALFLMMNEWVKVKQKGKSLTEYFEKNGYKKIAIYGMSFIGRRLYEELANYVEIDYAIDKNADNICMDICIYLPNDHLEEVDAIIVTTVMHFDEITELLQKKVKCPVLSLENIIDELFLNCLE